MRIGYRTRTTAGDKTIHRHSPNGLAGYGDDLELPSLW
jgi:hypothetical protein